MKVIAAFPALMRLNALISFFLISLTGCSKPALNAIPPSLSAPEVRLEQAGMFALQFPPTLPGENGKVGFAVKVRNCSGQSLSVNDIETSCGCVDAEMDETRLDPDQVGTLKLIMARSTVSGVRSASATLAMAPIGLVHVTVRAKVLPRLEIEGGPRLWMGSVPAGKTKKGVLRINIHSSRDDPKPELVAKANNDVHLESPAYLGSERVGAQFTRHRFEVRFFLPARRMTGNYASDLSFVVAETSQSTNVPIFWKVSSDLFSTPRRVFVKILPGTTHRVEREVRLERASGAAVDDIHWKCSQSWFGCSEMPSPTGKVVVWVEPRLLDRKFSSGDIFFQIPGPDACTYRFPVTAIKLEETQ